MKKHLTLILCLMEAAFFLACQKVNESTPPVKVGIIYNLSVPDDCGQLRTQTQGGWGANPKGDNPGTYLDTHFTTAFPAGLKVGCCISGFTLSYTSAAAITEFLPAGGTAAALTANYVNPSSKSIKNVLIGQLTALTLNVGFDYFDPNFGASETNLGDMVIASGVFAGKSVNEFLVIANNVLGGCSNTYTPSQVNETATMINENFDDGNIDNHFLNCPAIR